jgi:hypothetical protein
VNQSSAPPTIRKSTKSPEATRTFSAPSSALRAAVGTPTKNMPTTAPPASRSGT